MLIIGRGFISQSFAKLAHLHSDTLLFGSGVSDSLSEDAHEFRREADLLYSAIRYCSQRAMRLVYFSSAGMVYGNYEQEVSEEGPVFPRSSYGRHKLAMESVIRMSGINYLILRLSNPIGANQKPHQLIPSLYHQVERGFVEVWTGAHRDLIDIEDVVSLTSAVLTNGIERNTLNMASGYAISVEEIVNYFEKKSNVFVLRNYTDRGDKYNVCIDKIKDIVGSHFFDHIDNYYYQRVLDKYF